MVGNGMAGVRTIEELLKVAPDLYDITVFGAEPHPNYNRILLSPVLAGEQSLDPLGSHRRAGLDALRPADGDEAGVHRDHQHGDQNQPIQRQQPQDAPFLGRGVVDHLARQRRVGVLALQSEHRPQRPLRDSAVLGRWAPQALQRCINSNGSLPASGGCGPRNLCCH